MSKTPTFQQRVSKPTAAYLHDYLTYQYPACKGDIMLEATCQAIATLESERDAARALNAKCICMYCGKEYDRNAPDTAAQLADHVMTCEKSPLVQMLAECKVLIEQAEADRDRARLSDQPRLRFAALGSPT